MDQETARTLLVKGATLVLEDFPPGSEFGIDMNVYRTGDKFKGIKMIPPGVHFIYYSTISDYDLRSLAPRAGSFQIFTESQMFLRKWDKVSEDIDSSERSADEVDRYRNNLIGTLDQFLAPYDLSSYEKWSGLTDFIDEKVVMRLNPRNGRIGSVPELIPQSFSSSISKRRVPDAPIELPAKSSSLTSDQLDRLLPQLERDASSAINFSVIGKSDRPPATGCHSAADITKYSLDATHRLQSLIDQVEGGSDSVLGEVQFAFVCFLIGHVYEAFEHWKNMIRLICTSNHALEKYDSFFLNFIRVLHFQLQEVPADLFVDIVNCNNFLLLNLRDLFFNLENNDHVSPQLRRRGHRFRQNLEEKFKWDFNIENSDDEEAPVIVQLDDEG
jgi:A1 cistron-splicing factor AAR2